MNKNRIQELKQLWENLASHVYDEQVLNDEEAKGWKDFHAFVEETYYLFYEHVVAGNVPKELAEIAALIRKIARMPRATGADSINLFTVVSKALSDWIKLYSLDKRYRRLKKGVLAYYPEYILKRGRYKYYVGSEDNAELASMFDEINKKDILFYKHDIRELESRLEELLNDEHYEFSWEQFVDAAKHIAEVLDGYNEYNDDALGGFMMQDSVHLPMRLYAYSHKEPHFECAENGYAFNASRLIAYTLSQIAVGSFREQKDGEYDPDNLVVYDEDFNIIGTIDAHTFDISDEFIHYADFYKCVDPDECRLDSIEVEKPGELKAEDIIETEFYPYSNEYSSSYKITVKSNGEIGDFWREPTWGPQYTYQIKDGVLYLGLYYGSNFAFAFMPKTCSDIKKIYLTNGKADKLIWEKPAKAK